MSKHGPHDFGKLIWDSSASWAAPRFLLESFYGRTVDDICARIHNESGTGAFGVFLDNYRGQGLHREKGCDEH